MSGNHHPGEKGKTPRCLRQKLSVMMSAQMHATASSKHQKVGVDRQQPGTKATNAATALSGPTVGFAGAIIAISE